MNPFNMQVLLGGEEEKSSFVQMITRTGMASWCEFSNDADFLLFLETV